MKKIKQFFTKIYKFIDKTIIVPITKLILKSGLRFDSSSKKLEKWLSKTNTILFISLFLAIMIFIGIDQKVINLSDSSAEVISNVPVTVEYNEEAYVIEGLPEQVDITLIGSRSNLYIAKQSTNHGVVIDLNGLKPGQHKVNITYNQASPLIDYKVNPSTATIYIYQKKSRTKTLTKDILNKDSLDSKLVIDDIQIDDDKVTIKGSDQQLNKVASVKALIDIENLPKQGVGNITLNDIPLRAYDENGNAVNVEIVPNKISAQVIISSPSHEIPIKVIPVGNVTFGKAISAIDQSATKVTVYGDKDVVANLQYLPVEISVEDLKSTQEFKIELKKPTGVTSMSVNSITVKVALDVVDNRTIDNVGITFENVDSKYIANALNTENGFVSIELKGVKSVIDQITVNDITAYLDLTGYKEGRYEVEVQVEGIDNKVQYTSKTKKVWVVISKRPD